MNVSERPRELGDVLQKLAGKVKGMSEKIKQLEAENAQLRTAAKKFSASEPQDRCNTGVGGSQAIAQPDGTHQDAVIAEPVQELQNIQTILAQLETETGQAFTCAQV